MLWAWLAMIGLATARSIGGGRGLPQPNSYLASGVLFTMLMGAAGILGGLAAAVAVGTDVAAIALPYLRGSTTGPLDTIAQALDSISGGGTSGGSGAPVEVPGATLNP